VTAPRKLILVLAGPTASGKTDLAEGLAKILPVRLLSADSQQVYRGMDIGTCKPTMEARKDWGLVDLADPGEPFSAGSFSRAAAELCRLAWADGRIPLLCGGTGLYLKALLEGLAEIPPIPVEVRQGLEEQYALNGLEPLLDRLDDVDPDLAAGVDRANPRRVLRALEVFEATGKPLSAWQAAETRPALQPDAALWLGLDPGKDALARRIAQRVDACLSQGWLEEVRTLRARHGADVLRRSAAIGYPELLGHLEGHCSLAEARDAVLRRTRGYARRQRTWFRAVPALRWSAEAPELAALAQTFVHKEE